ncbi:MAG TPA: hypothetical protein VFF79_11050 [Conexibacter sp.]|jgi:hypothetical protein|nr:hypothetical protein [Conexibacter sp.]
MSDAPTESLPIPMPAPAHPAAAASCRNCSAALAPDQRYCLSCGVRVAAPRVEWAGALGAPAAASGAAGQPAAGGARAGGSWALMLDRIGGPMGLAAVVLVALGVGYLLGQGGSGTSGPATIIQRPPIVNVQGGGTATPGDTSGAGSSGSTANGRSAKGRAAGGSTAGIPQATPDSAGGNLNRLRAQPQNQATGGTAPRRDNKPSGGGTGAETIG